MASEEQVTETKEFREISFVVEIVRRRFDPPVKIPSNQLGSSWYYECFARIYFVNRLDAKKPIRFFGYRIDGKEYAGHYVPLRGFGYRIYHIGGGCVRYAIPELEEAIQFADNLLEESLANLSLTRPKKLEEQELDSDSQMLLWEEFGLENITGRGLQKPIEIKGGESNGASK